MKRLFTVLMFLLLIASEVFALSDSEYLKMKKNNAGFARADKKLTQVWKQLKDSMSKEDFEALQKDQRKWISEGRDKIAKSYMKEGYSRVEAYMLATNDRAKELPEIAKSINNFEPEEIIENEQEQNFETPSTPQGKYIKSDNDGRNIFMTVSIIDKNSMEAQVSFSFENSDSSWIATGWIENNVLELYDRNFSSCSAVLTFSDNSVRVEATDSEDWTEILGYENNLDGKYFRN